MNTLRAVQTALLSLCAMGVALTAGLPAGHARAFRVEQIPNGDVRSCATCHVGSNFAERNAFGSAVEQTLRGVGVPAGRDVDWGAVAGLDSDGDGVSNGAELGDPDGVWRPGAEQPDGEITHPGDPSSVPTGETPDPPDDGGDSNGGDDDEGCAVSPGTPGGGGVLWVLTVALTWALRKRDSKPEA